uniref:C2H2-type domain-containing protein n=1 Tax=Tetranychus urticae TaxID=32264 RepID=T1L6H0_TETUR
MYSILTNKISKHGVRPYRSERAARCSTSLITSSPTFNKIVKAGVVTFQCSFFECKYIFTQHHKLIVHQTLMHGLIECEKCSVAYFTKAEKDNCFAKHDSQGNAESTITEDIEGDLQRVIEGILDAEDENLVTPIGSSQSSSSQPSCSLVQGQTLLPTLILKRFKCQKTECGRTFENEWALKSHFCACQNDMIPKISGIDSTVNINKESCNARKAKSVESVEFYSTDSSSDGDTDDVGKDLTCKNRIVRRYLDNPANELLGDMIGFKYLCNL